ncbi:hypothetical protein DsansV1_C08g0086031 [Dioscorea sansibarensis]
MPTLECRAETCWSVIKAYHWFMWQPMWKVNIEKVFKQIKDMTSNGNSMSISQPSLPIFKGENYDFWSIKMRTLFKSQNLWDLVENGYQEQDEEARLKENKKKDSEALFFIQQAMHETLFSRIAATTTSKQTWEVL